MLVRDARDDDMARGPGDLRPSCAARRGLVRGGAAAARRNAAPPRRRARRAACRISWPRSTGGSRATAMRRPIGRGRPIASRSRTRSMSITRGTAPASGARCSPALIARCERGDWRQMIAVIGDSAQRGLDRLACERSASATSARCRRSASSSAAGSNSVLMQRALGARRVRESGPAQSAIMPRECLMPSPREFLLGPWRAVRCSASRKSSPGARSSIRRC